MTRQRPEREFYIVISGKFRTLAMFSNILSVICQEPGSGLWWPLPSSILSCISAFVEFFWLPPPPPPSAKGDSVIAEICLPGVANPRSCGNFYSLSFPPCKKCLMKIFLCTSTVDLLTPRSPGSNTNLTLINTPSAMLKVKVSSNSKYGQEGGAFTVKHQYIWKVNNSLTSDNSGIVPTPEMVTASESFWLNGLTGMFCLFLFVSAAFALHVCLKGSNFKTVSALMKTWLGEAVTKVWRVSLGKQKVQTSFEMKF